MKSYTLTLRSSGEFSEYFAANDFAAVKKASTMLACHGYDNIAAGDWIDDGKNDDNKSCKRVLIWASAKDMVLGARYIAEIDTVR